MAPTLGAPQSAKYRAPQTRKTTAKGPNRCVNLAPGEKRRLVGGSNDSSQHPLEKRPSAGSLHTLTLSHERPRSKRCSGYTDKVRGQPEYYFASTRRSGVRSKSQQPIVSGLRHAHPFLSRNSPLVIFSTPLPRGASLVLQGNSGLPFSMDAGSDEDGLRRGLKCTGTAFERSG